MVQDVSYSSGAICRYLRRRGIRLTIPRKDKEKHRGKFDQAIYRTRNVVERCFNRLKQFRRIATRYEKNAAKLPSHADFSLYLVVAIVLRHALESSDIFAVLKCCRALADSLLLFRS